MGSSLPTVCRKHWRLHHILLCIFSLVFLLLLLQNPRGSESVSHKTENCPALGDGIFNSRFGLPRSPVAILSPPCRLPVGFPALLTPCLSPVACLLLPCRSPVAPLSLSCQFPVAFLPPSCPYPVASCRLLSFPVAILIFAWRLPVALLSLSCHSFLSPSCRYFLLPPCRPPVACLSSSCSLPVASLSPPCRLLVAQLNQDIFM